MIENELVEYMGLPKMIKVKCDKFLETDKNENK